MITNNILLVALGVTATMFCIICLAFVYLVVQRRRLQKKKQWIDAYIERSTDEWYQYIVNGQSLPNQPQHRYLHDAIDQIFLTYELTIKGAQMDEHISTYAEKNMQAYYRKQVFAKNWAVRVNGLRRIIIFKLHFLVPEVTEALRKGQYRSKEEYMTMLRIASTYEGKLFFEHLLKPKMHLHEYDFKLILSQIDDWHHQGIMDQFDNFSFSMQLAFLDYLSYQTSLDERYLQFFEQVLHSIYKEFRVKALKAIQSFGMISSLSIYKQFVVSEEWEERLMVTKILRTVSDEEAFELLEKLICDPHYAVRKRAAEILKTKRNGEAVLQKLLTQDDRYAAEMAKEVLMMG